MNLSVVIMAFRKAFWKEIVESADDIIAV